MTNLKTEITFSRGKMIVDQTFYEGYEYTVLDTVGLALLVGAMNI